MRALLQQPQPETKQVVVEKLDLPGSCFLNFNFGKQPPTQNTQAHTLHETSGLFEIREVNDALASQDYE